MSQSWEEAFEGREIVLRGWQRFHRGGRAQCDHGRASHLVAYDGGPERFGVVFGSGEREWRLGEADDVRVLMNATHRYLDLDLDTRGRSHQERFDIMLADAEKEIEAFDRFGRSTLVIGQIGGEHASFQVHADSDGYSILDADSAVGGEPLCTSECFDAVMRGLHDLLSERRFDRYSRVLRNLAQTVAEAEHDIARASRMASRW